MSELVESLKRKHTDRPSHLNKSWRFLISGSLNVAINSVNILLWGKKSSTTWNFKHAFRPDFAAAATCALAAPLGPRSDEFHWGMVYNNVAIKAVVSSSGQHKRNNDAVAYPDDYKCTDDAVVIPWCLQAERRCRCISGWLQGLDRHGCVWVVPLQTLPALDEKR